MPRKSTFKTKLSFYFLAIGSACGLGNVWRFPYVVGENGGGAFLLVYIFLSFTLGLSLLVSELLLGRNTGSGLLESFKSLKTNVNKNYIWVARFGLIIGFVILGYYSVVSGWVIHYIFKFLTGFINTSNTLDSNSQINYFSQLKLSSIVQNSSYQFLLAALHLLICGYIVLTNLTDRFEKFFKSILPYFVILFILLLVRSLTLDSTSDALRFIFYPDFSKLNLSSLGQAVGHVLYTLSLGMGIMVTFGSYFDHEENLPRLAFNVTLIDTLVSIVSVLMIFPVVFLNNNAFESDKAGLLFDSLSQLALKTHWGVLFGLVFFICLWVVAINASISILETLIVNVSEKIKIFERKKIILLIIAGVLSSIFSLSLFLVLWDQYKKGVVETLDSALINYALPLSALLFTIFFVKAYSKEELEKQFMLAQKEESRALFDYWMSFVVYAVPTIIGLGLVLQIIYLFK